jgi:hypothetical protein
MPKRVIAGQATKLSRGVHDIRYDPVDDEIYYSSIFGEAILVFAGDANGERPPKRIIQGPKTLYKGTDRLEIDSVHNEIIIPQGNEILVFPKDASGDVAPIRVLRGKDTQLRLAGSTVVDPVSNLLIVGLNMPNSEESRDAGQSTGPPNGAILIFNRTDEGNVKPLRVIKGPISGITRINQMAVYPPKGWIVATQAGEISDVEPEGVFVGVWSEMDNGDVPPRWKIGNGPKSTIKKPRGVVLDPRHKELIVADMRLNAVLTYYFPEIF